MRVSRLMLVTLRDVPAEAEITSHQLLLRGGFIRRVGSGIYAYLPSMEGVSITSIVREEMNGPAPGDAAAPTASSELWKRSGRRQGYTAGEGIASLDRQGRELGPGPTMKR